MKNNISIIFFLAFAGLLLTTSSCEREKDSEGISKITYFPDFKMTGDEVIFLNKGTAFTDPGVKAYENGIEIPVRQSVTGDYFPANAIDVNMPNKYIINYAATNKDGFDGSTSRIVFVVATGDLITSIEGLYTSTIVRNGVSSPNYTDLEYVMIRKAGDNTYEISDAIGGYYDIGRGYGAAYRATGALITANNISANDFDLGPSFGVGAFGGTASITSFSVNAATGTITMVTDWDAGFTFEVTLKQVKF
jgi:hypothetical protein